MNKCKDLYDPPKPTILYRPRNVAVLRGEPAVMNCTGRNLGDFHTIRWDYKNSISNEVSLVSLNNILYPIGQGIVKLTDTYNIEFSYVNGTTTGQFQCDAYDEETLGIFNAFLMEMGKVFKKSVTVRHI